MIIDENSKPREKLKAWYLFTDDFIAGTQHLTNLEVGIYIRLLCWNWNKKCVGIPSDNITYYRIASCHTHNEREACDNVLREFFILMETNKYQNAKQLEEYIYITRRMEASRENGRLGGRPKKPSQNPPTLTTTNTTKQTKISYSPHFLKFWDKVVNKVSKGIAEKNYVKLENPIYAAGAYKFESLGCNLFSYVNGSSYTIRGMPLLPLLSKLREMNIINLEKSTN